MKIFRAMAATAGFLLFTPLVCTAAESDLTISVREQRTLQIPADLERIAVADPEIADVVVLRGTARKPGSILVVGKKPGRTVVTAWPRSGAEKSWHINVQSQLQSQLPKSGAELQINDGNALIRGEAPSLLSHAGTTAVATSAVGQDRLLDTSTVGVGGVVQIDVKIVEFSKKVLKETGFDFLYRQDRGAVFSFGLNTFTSLLLPGTQTPEAQAFNLLGSSSVDAKLKLIEENGLARVLAQPSLTALSGQSASFLAGGELPIPQSGGLGTTTIVFKPFGIGLTVTPTVLAANRIALKVAPEASDIDYLNALNVNDMLIPAITTRRAETTLELGDGESFIIGGLVSRTTKSNASKIPLLGDLPIIGAFFRSMNYTQDEKELVIIVTPRLVKPIAKGVQLALPGSGAEKRDTPANAWSYYLMGKAGNEDLPGFSK